MMFTMLGCWQSCFLGRELLAGSPTLMWGRTPVVLAGYLWPMPGPTTGQPARERGNQARGLSTDYRQ